MNLLPPPGPQRTRLMVLVVLLAIASAGAYYMNFGSGSQAPSPTVPSRAASNGLGPIGQATSPAASGTQKPAVIATGPEPLKLPDLERVPDEPIPGRNPFKFGAKALPPPPPPVYTPPPTPTPLPPPPPPQVPLTLTGVMLLEPHAKNRAYLTDKSGGFFEAVEGQIVDGRYRLVAVGKDTAVVEFLDGTGRRTLRTGVKFQ